jgi:hypothetical protein
VLVKSVSTCTGNTTGTAGSGSQYYVVLLVILLLVEASGTGTSTGLVVAELKLRACDSCKDSALVLVLVLKYR